MRPVDEMYNVKHSIGFASEPEWENPFFSQHLSRRNEYCYDKRYTSKKTYLILKDALYDFFRGTMLLKNWIPAMEANDLQTYLAYRSLRSYSQRSVRHNFRCYNDDMGVFKDYTLPPVQHITSSASKPGTSKS